MRTFLLFVRTTVVTLGLLVLLETINHFVTHQQAFNLAKDYPLVIVFLLVIPMSAVLHHRIVDRVYLEDQLTLEQIESVLLGFKAKLVSREAEHIEYQLPASTFWEKKVAITIEQGSISVSAPIKVIRKMEKLMTIPSTTTL